jgi:hypothetical protein
MTAERRESNFERLVSKSRLVAVAAKAIELLQRLRD